MAPVSKPGMPIATRGMLTKKKSTSMLIRERWGYQQKKGKHEVKVDGASLTNIGMNSH